VIPEIDIWRVANLMLTRYGDEALAEGTKRAEELAAECDLAGVAVWLRVIDAIRQLAITTPNGAITLDGSFRGRGGGCTRRCEVECRVPRRPDRGRGTGYNRLREPEPLP
jgi:hypothetical protein